MPEINRENSWITSKEALHLAAGALGGSNGRGMTALREKARAGLIATKALKVMGAASETHNMILAREFWAPSKGLIGAATTVPFEDWEGGSFGGPAFSRVGLEAKGVLFHGAQVELFFPPSLKRARTPKLRRPPGHWWHQLCLEMCRVTHYEGVPEGTGSQGIEALVGTLIERLSEQGVESLPSRSAIRPVVGDMLLLLRARP